MASCWFWSNAHLFSFPFFLSGNEVSLVKNTATASAQPVFADHIVGFDNRCLRGPAHVKTVSPTNYQNHRNNYVILDCSLSKPWF